MTKLYCANYTCVMSDRRSNEYHVFLSVVLTLAEYFCFESQRNDRSGSHIRCSGGGSRIFFRRGCSRLLLYFNTNKPHIFFLQNNSCIRKPQVISRGGGGVRTPCTLPLDPPPMLATFFSIKSCLIITFPFFFSVAYTFKNKLRAAVPVLCLNIKLC